MRKVNSISVDKTFSKDRLEVPQGKFTFGTGNDHNSTFKNVVVGSAYTQGNTIRSLYDMNDNGSLCYNSTENDNSDQIRRNIQIFDTYPTLIGFPYLTNHHWSPNDVINNSQTFPIFNVPGKGLGNIEWWTSSNRVKGNENEGVQKNVNFYEEFIDNVIDVSPRILNDVIFPFSGKNYSGVLVQIHIEQNDINKPYKNIKVLPYQTGRGIPQYNPNEMYFGGNPYGTPTWPDSGNDIPPQLSMGSVPGNNNASIGVILDTEKISQQNIIYKYTKPNFLLNPTNWFFHSAPFTISPKNGISPINSVGRYAPWSSDYCYNGNEPIPILTRGQTTLRIGAAFNIGMQAYYEPDIEDGDDPLIDVDKYVSVSIIPLFQGEELRIGSFVYSSVQGHVITPDKLATSCYPVPVFRDRLEEQYNPWYDWSDITYGATGWTGTPQFQLSGIPDEGVAIIETKNGETLPYLSQANQGSIIVQPITTKNPASTNGSGRMTLISPGGYEQSEDCKFTNITKFTGAPERAQPVGTSINCIKGTGSWNYTGGSILSATQTIISPGTEYSDSFDVECYNSTQNNLILSVDVISGVISSVDDVGSGSTVIDFDDYPVGTQLSIVKTPTNIITFDTNARIEVSSNDGTAVISFSIINGGTGFIDGIGISMNTQKLNIENPTVDILTSGGIITSVKLRDVGINNFTGDVILIETNFTGSFTIDTTIETEGFKQIKGGYGYEIGTTIPGEVLDISGSSLYDVNISGTEGNSFSLTNFFQNTSGISFVNDFIHVRQNTHQDITTTGPGGVPSPVFGWDSYLFTQSAQNTQQPPLTSSLISGGTGYSRGIYSATNGTSVVDVEVFAVTSTGEVTSITLNIDASSGTQIGQTTPYTISGGGFDATFLILIPTHGFFDTGYITGGTGYSTSTGVSTRNLSTNSLFILGQVDLPVAGNCTAYGYDPSGPTATAMVMPTKNTIDGGFVFIDLSRYIVSDIITFEQSPGVTGTFSITSLDVATSELVISQSDFGSGFVIPPNSDYAFFPTTNTSETATTVDITTNSDGKIIGVSINTLGDRIRYGDYLLVEGGNENFVFQFTPEMNVPAPWQPFINLRPATPTEWNDYKNVMKSSVNLLEKNLLTNFNPMYPNYFNNSYYFDGDGGTTTISEE